MRSGNLKKNRQKYLAASGRRCERCLNTVGLHLHHITYENFEDENNVDVMVLCKACHQELHGLVNDFKKWASIYFAQNAEKCCRPGDFEKYGFRPRWNGYKAKEELLDIIDAIALERDYDPARNK